MVTNTKILQLLLNDSANYNLKTFIRLSMSAASYPNVDLTVRDKNGKTLLDHLILSNENGANNQEIENLLRINQNLINTRDDNGYIPLQDLLLSSDEVSIEVIEKFLDWGSNIHHRDHFGESLLHSCCASGNLDAARFFDEQGLELKATSELGNTLLHSAVRSKNQALWVWLINSGIDINAKNQSGETALDLAERENTPMMNWLLQNGAKNSAENQALPVSDYCLSATSMQVLGSFIAVLSVAAVALALTLLTLPTFGVGLVAGAGAVVGLIGLGFFAAGTTNKCYAKPSEEVAYTDNTLTNNCWV